MVTVSNVVAFNRRYNPLNQQFKRVVEQMSQVYYAECQFYRNRRYYQDFITATGIHGINYMEYLFGPIETVTTDKWKNPVNETHIWVNRVSFASGINGLLKFFPCSGANLERYEVHSNDTSAYLYSPQAYTEDIPGQIMVYEESKLQPVIRGNEDEDPLMTLGFVSEYSDFFEACMQNTPTISNFQNACHSMRIAEAIETGNDIP
jgi:predicted dehydrogenase